ncbi:hypothetical protein A9500_04595 [Haemophilus sp. CCUG 60358]|uniref:hypothetical protein n=1 Tax=Haemophilus sp. CCUG 60358 TaxID=1859695 RepID=UPI0008032597|nr:hypothetical protein [Haemophilus sp. CCUG 60358]OBX90368.1 hypothetical protein A9500_04595 [Haemophilus sp. CCUG 60358]
MIIGNPGIYDSKGNFNNFAIQIDNIVDTDYFSVNLCIDMNIYPPQLASNKASYLIDYFNPELEIFSNIHDDLFYLDDRDLMINLMAKGFGYTYAIEELIKENKIDYQEFINNEDIFFEKLNLVKQSGEVNPYLWEIDYMEYVNKGFYPFVINSSSGLSKVIVVFNKNRSYDLDYIEDRLLLSNIRASKSVGFFDEQFWGVKVSCIKTDELSLIINKIQSVLSAFK